MILFTQFKAFRDFFSSIGLILTAALLLSACSTDVSEKNNENSSFSAAQVSAVSILQEGGTDTNLWNGVVYGTNITFKVCLNDIAIENQPARNAKISVHSPFQNSTVVSDVNGCLSWSEYIEFNFLEKENYYSYEVKLIGISPFKGSVTKKLLINPWSKSLVDVVKDTDWIEGIDTDGADIRNLTYEDTTRSLQKNFKVKNLAIKLRERIIDGQNGIENLIYDFSMKPYLIRKDINDNDVDVTADNGIVRIEMSLYEKRPGKSLFRLVDETTEQIEFKDHVLDGSLKLKLSRKDYINSGSTFKIHMKVLPVKAPMALGHELVQTYFNSLESNFSLEAERVNVFSNDIIEHSGDEDQLLDENIDTFITENNFQVDHDDEFGYMINTVHFEKGSIVSGNYNQGSLKKLSAIIKVCLVDPRSAGKRKPIADTSFKTEIFLSENKLDTDEARIRPVNSNGCLETKAVITYDKFDVEHFIPLKLKLTGMEGHFEGIIKERLLAINPWASGSTFGHDIKVSGLPPVIKAPPPRINITDVSYSNEGNNMESFRLNNYLNLSFIKNFQTNFKLYYERFHSYAEESSLQPLTFGKYKAKILLMSPNQDDVDYNNVDLKQFSLITAHEQIIEVKANGDVVTNLELPLVVSDSYLLGYKNLLLINVSPIDPSTKLRPITIAAPFYGIGAGATVKTQSVELSDIDEKTLIRARELISDKSKILDSHVGKSPLELFQDEFKRRQNENKAVMDVKFYTASNINKAPLKGGQWLSFLSTNELNGKKNEWFPDLNFEDLRMITSTPGDIESRVLRKFCRHFYPIPSRTRTRVVGIQTVRKKGESFLNCLKSPREHIATVPMTHIQKVLPTRIRKNGKVIGLRFAQMVAQDKGKVYRGDAFFAAHGSRFNRSYGDRTSWGAFGGVEIAPKIPLFFGMRGGYSVELFAYEGTENASMHMDYERSFTQRTKMDLDYDSLTLRFRAQVRNCASITSKKNVNVKIHLCEDEDRYKNSLTETWYFIGRSDMRKNGVLADANKPAADYEHQVIRGTHNYNVIWSKFKKEDVFMQIENMGTAELSTSFKDVLSDRAGNTPNENRSDNSFPGLFIPVTKQID